MQTYFRYGAKLSANTIYPTINARLIHTVNIKTRTKYIYGLPPLQTTTYFVFMFYADGVFGVIRLWDCGVLSCRVCVDSCCVGLRVCVYVFVLFAYCVLLLDRV